MLELCEKTFAVTMLFYMTGAFLSVATARLSGYSGLSRSAIELVIQSLFYAVAFCFIGVHWRRVVHGAQSAKWILVLLCIAFASTAWSQDPLVTLRRASVLAATTLFGIYFATRFNVDTQLRLLACTCALVIVVSFACALLLPQYGIDHTYHYGDWQGAFNQKNMLARAMVLAIFVFFFVRVRHGQAFQWLGIAAAVTLLVLSQSVTGIIVFVAIIALFPICKLFRTTFTFGIPVAAILAVSMAAACVLIYVQLPWLLEVLHRDEGLTGRADLWNAVFLSIGARPWLGYGFDAFWRGMTGESANVLSSVGWAPEYAHNGFLDLMLDLGFLGLVTFAAGYLVLWRRALTFLARDGGPIALWLCMYLAFMFFYNLTEGPVISQNNITWVLYVAVAVSLALYLPAKPRIDVDAVL